MAAPLLTHWLGVIEGQVMSLEEYKGAAYFIRELMRAAERDCADGGEVKPARRLWKRPHPAKTAIGWFEARVLRGEFRRKRRA